MKPILFFVAIIFSSFSFAQDTTSVKRVEAPIIVSKLYLGEAMLFEDLEVRFVEVVEDSRCPKNVNCIWAGEVTILVEVYRDSKKIAERKLTISPTNSMENLLGNIFASEEISISGINIMPYPVAGQKPAKEDYYLQLEYRN
ncbi:hypothetical protein [Oceanihabitans sediminis]|uniref:DUF4402 domain-containing protein n=1 Tax=Oceanihabitans sediminis TaxID=1812012 RepID=A0A368PAI8_9FLAO|nr:hypothetical protein [Oceanihabitans sediminis]MDX1278064.1 hypothetical protein [Oceanihabitans sediminis]RBP34578.1 hypothetical protein DFR65_101474 [Oceanihabitans sediminis]RCU58241.1 hypothetical protein DU428_02360 [Oceanihabitans sediminis]